MKLTMHRAPVPEPVDEPFGDDVPPPVPQDDPVPDHNPESDSLNVSARWQGVFQLQSPLHAPQIPK